MGTPRDQVIGQQLISWKPLSLLDPQTPDLQKTQELTLTGASLHSLLLSSASLAMALGERCTNTLRLCDFPLLSPSRGIRTKSSPKSASLGVLWEERMRSKTIPKDGCLGRISRPNQPPIFNTGSLEVLEKGEDNRLL